MDKVVFLVEGLVDSGDEMYFRVTDHSGDDMITKVVSYDELRNIINRAYLQTEVFCSVGEVPEGYIDGNVSTRGGGEVILYREPGKHVLFIRDEENSGMPMSFMIPFPGLLFRIRYGENGMVSGHVLCTMGSFSEVKDRYTKRALDGYMYPFGNVSGDGSVCMGNIKLSISSLKDTEKYVGLFLDGVTNNDYMSTKLCTVTDITDQVELAKRLEEEDQFPVEWLVPYKDEIKNWYL